MGIGFHVVLILRDPHSYDGFSTSALIPLYRWGFREIVMRSPLAFALAAAAFEIAVELLMLGKRQYAKIGLLAGSLFLFAITPLGVETLPNALLALSLVYLVFALGWTATTNDEFSNAAVDRVDFVLLRATISCQREKYG
jgi:hypothetical protein